VLAVRSKMFIISELIRSKYMTLNVCVIFEKRGVFTVLETKVGELYFSGTLNNFY
jgi:hypothetical protein